MNRTRRVCVRLTAEEFQKVQDRFEKTMDQSLSEYCRALLLREKIRVKYRNESMDNLIEELVTLRRELKAIGINLNQAVHKLHTLEAVDQHFSNRFEELVNHKLEPSIEIIMNRIVSYWDMWMVGLSQDGWTNRRPRQDLSSQDI